MQRALLLTPLLIVSLLACPLRCVGMFHGGEDTEAAAASSGSCCAHCSSKASPSNADSSDADSPPGEIPHVPADDCGCASCLCHGAVLDSGGAALDLESADCPLESAAIFEAKAAGAPIRARWLAEFPHSRSVGRTARIVHQSFLL